MFIILFASSSTMQLGSALRPLHAKPHIRNLISHAILQRAPVPPIGGNPCSTIPAPAYCLTKHVCLALHPSHLTKIPQSNPFTHLFI
ncbi:hypothetical protein WN943_028982 [Citrus x changshan-huyou]